MTADEMAADILCRIWNVADVPAGELPRRMVRIYAARVAACEEGAPRGGTSCNMVSIISEEV